MSGGVAVHSGGRADLGGITLVVRFG